MFEFVLGIVIGVAGLTLMQQIVRDVFNAAEITRRCANPAHQHKRGVFRGAK